jgi:hypothetical protein
MAIDLVGLLRHLLPASADGVFEVDVDVEMVMQAIDEQLAHRPLRVTGTDDRRQSDLELLPRGFFLLGRGLRQMLAHAILRREEHGDLRGAVALTEGDVFDGHAKEAREAECLDLRRCRPRVSGA